MAGKQEVKGLRRKSRIAALEGLRSTRAFPVPPRKAMSLAKKKSKGLPYPLPPYAGQNPLLLASWVQNGWNWLGRYKKLALPVIIFTALTTWEKERALRDARWEQIEREETIRFADELYAKASAGPLNDKKRLWPFKRGKKPRN